MDIRAVALRVAIDHMAAKGLQVKRKDKDLMQDTGGTSKGRLREPHVKPPRTDKLKRYNKKRQKPDDVDLDIDKDKSVRKPARRKSSYPMIHPLDRTQKGAWEGLEIPEENYHRQVYRALWNILESEGQVSEKDFTGQDKIRAACEKIMRSPEAEGFVQRCSGGNQRAALCAEWIYEDAMGLTQMRR